MAEPGDIPGVRPRWSWRDPRPWLALVSLAAVLTVFLWETERTLPPPISAVHAQEAELRSTEGCHLCHGAGEVTRAEACFACHTEIGEQFAGGPGLHASRVADTGLDCGHCHIEHAGREFPLVAEHSFQRARFDSRAAFDHPFEGYDLTGAHDGLDCVVCHEHAEAVVLPLDARRFLGLSRECESCHGEDSPHEGRMGRSCESCHGQERPFAEVASFEHDERFALTGAHELDGCAACHAGGTSHSIEALASRTELPEVRACAACHEAPHQPLFLGGAAQLAGVPDDGACSLCHQGEQLAFPEARATLPAELHLAGGFDLDAPHAGLDCAACHELGLDWEARFPGRERRDCAACHEDAHAGQFASSPAADCADCHSERAFVPARFDLEQHGRCAFPLEGAHRAVTCYACHELAADAEQTRPWRGVATGCDDCHEDAHDRRFLEADGRATDCARCHDAQSFAGGVARAEFEHGRRTDFELDGAHGELECVECHRPSVRPDALGRSFGRIAAVFGEAPSAGRPCAACHADPHEVDFDAEGRPEQHDGRRGCARCHDTRAWRNASAAGFEHELWTERRLGGAHLALECSVCHQRAPRPDAFGRSFGRIRQRFGEDIAACATCHPDPHGGLFDGQQAPAVVEGRAGCARCHTEDSFLRLALADFDHDLWTANEVAGGHELQTCDDCHPRLSLAGRAARGRREARGRACDDCHGDAHAGQFARDGRSDCRACHASQADWAVLDFDHARDSRYALDEVHAPLECAACHPTYEQPGLAPLVRYKPLGVECVDCHGLPEPGPPR